jgi:hypothetical protein
VSGARGLHPPGPLAPWAGLLGVYVLLRGLDATVLKALHLQGERQLVNGENPISFCNVFCFAQLAIGLLALGAGRRSLGPIAYPRALQVLSVISQILPFALVLAVSALLSRMALEGRMDDPAGLLWALVGVLSFSGAALTSRAWPRWRSGAASRSWWRSLAPPCCWANRSGGTPSPGRCCCWPVSG